MSAATKSTNSRSQCGKRIMPGRVRNRGPGGKRRSGGVSQDSERKAAANARLPEGERRDGDRVTPVAHHLWWGPLYYTSTPSMSSKTPGQPAYQRPLDHGQSSGCATRPALTGFAWQ